MVKRARRSALGRGVGILVAAGLVAGALSLTPAMGAAKFSKGKAKKLFYTKGGADERFVNVDEIAYAHFATDGSLLPGKSKNVNSVSHIMDGPLHIYCIDVAVPFHVVTATMDTINGRFAAASSGDPGGECASQGKVGDATVFPYEHDGTSIAGNVMVLLA